MGVEKHGSGYWLLDEDVALIRDANHKAGRPARREHGLA